MTQPADLLVRDGFAFLHAPGTRAWLERHGALADWPAFAASWHGMRQDEYMADGGRYRRRRHACFSAGPAGVARLPDQPHFQTREYNKLHGGIERWFEPVPAAVAASDSLTTILAACHALVERLDPGGTWFVEIHQFRIEARAGEPGQPTPEGSHRDGVDWVLVLLIDRHNIARGSTTIHAPNGTPLGSFTLTDPLDAALVDDHRVFHGVTAVTPAHPDAPAWRDVLVVTLRRTAG
jgi:hypothetical protein